MTTTAEQIAEKPHDKRRALGRGLDSLLPAGPRIVAGTAASGAAAPATVPRLDAVAGEPVAAPAENAVLEIPLDQIDHNPYQTRTSFNSESLEELANSIKASGVMQPVVVRPGKDGRYTLILGERRCRAAKLAGSSTVPAIVRLVSDQQAAEMTIVENLQRQDLNCMEQAVAYARLSKDFKLTQEEIGLRVGVSRESVGNYVRLLRLPEPVMQYLYDGKLGFSEARVLLRLAKPDQIQRIADHAVIKHLSVQQLQDLVERVNLAIPKDHANSAASWIDPNVQAMQNELERLLGLRVEVKDRKGKGKIVIQYSSLDDFDRLVEMLNGKK
jgi:ParB family chromosome partitioning protein